MNLRSFIPSVLLLAAGAVPAAGGSITIDATPLADATSASVVLEVAITDNGELPDCARFGIRRRALYPCGDWEDVTCIAREKGTRTLFFVDTDVARNTTYQYEAIGYAPSTEPCTIPLADQIGFAAAFFPSGWPVPIFEFVTVGPDPTPVLHGQLASQDDPTANFFIRSTCSNSCFGVLGTGGWGNASVAAYFDTGIDVLVYGTIGYCGNPCFYVLYATAAEPRACTPIAVEAQTWTHVKRLYKDATR